jgi:glutamate decarboxylase
VDLRVLSRRLRERGWIVPAYTLPPNADHITVLRMVIKENVSRDMVELLAADVRSAFEALAHEAHARPQRPRTRRRPHC